MARDVTHAIAIRKESPSLSHPFEFIFDLLFVVQCDTLGFNKQNLPQITVIDFALDDICRMDWLIHFPNLKELNIVNNGVSEIEGLDKCRLLEKVWLSCHTIDTIRQMDRLPCLRHLYLGSNKIRRIRNLDKCILLERLWIDENRLESIE